MARRAYDPYILKATGTRGGNLTAAFNSRANDVHEVEIKFLVPGNNRSVFDSIEQYFTDQSWIQFSVKDQNLLTRQLDTLKRDLLQKDTTIRIRGTCPNGELNDVTTPDICVKTGKTKDPSGAVRRGEYEARTASFSQTDLEALFTRYPEDSYPELHAVLDGLKPEDLREFFRIDCRRNRYVVDIPESESGLAGKKFVAELIMDDVVYVMDIPGLDEPLVFHRDFEVECEALFSACDYDTHPDAHHHVSDPMSAEETDQAMAAIKRLITSAAQGKLQEHHNSKAERGFQALDRLPADIQDRLTLNNEKAPNSGDLTAAFTLKSRGGNDSDHADDPAPPLRSSCTISPDRTIAHWRRQPG